MCGSRDGNSPSKVGVGNNKILVGGVVKRAENPKEAFQNEDEIKSNAVSYRSQQTSYGFPPSRHTLEPLPAAARGGIATCAAAPAQTLREDRFSIRQSRGVGEESRT